MDEELFAAFAGETKLRMSEFKSQEIASTAWTFATLGQLDEELFAALARAAVWQAGGRSRAELGNGEAAGTSG